MKRRNFAYTVGLGLVSSKVLGGGEVRRPVVPRAVVERFKLRPSEGYGLFVLGEDERPYNLDDVLAALFELTRQHWQNQKMQMKR